MSARTLHTIGSILVARETRKAGTWRVPIATPALATPSTVGVAGAAGQEVGEAEEEEEGEGEQEEQEEEQQLDMFSMEIIDEDSAEEDEEVEASFDDESWEDGDAGAEGGVGEDAW